VIPHSKDAVQVTQHFANHFIRFVVVGCNLLFIHLKLAILHLVISGSTHHLLFFFVCVEIYQKLIKHYTPFVMLPIRLSLLNAGLLPLKLLFFRYK